MSYQKTDALAAASRDRGPVPARTAALADVTVRMLHVEQNQDD